jgi:phosphoribosylformylglycinamidine cyclo-ligase
MRYADAGVNIAASDETKRRIAAMARRTFTHGVLAPVGGFGALFQLDRKRWRDPILVSSADGVGTKLKIAFATGIHSTVGVDILNHCINDILTQGAQPLFFLDYLAMGKIDPRIVEQVGAPRRLRADRRRNRRDARFLSAGRLRPRGIRRRCRRKKNAA